MIKKMKKFSKILGVLFLTALLPSSVLAATPFTTVFGGSCDTWECWIQKVWTWSMGVLIPLSVLILTAAGVIYMTSEGDSTRIGLAKKMIIGVLSGVGILILGRLLLTIILGDASSGGWTF